MTPFTPPPPTYLLSFISWQWDTPGDLPWLPTFSSGQRYGTTYSPEFAASLPRYESHETAIRHFMEHPHMAPLPSRPGITPTDIMDLRLSIRSRIPDILSETSIVPCVRYNSTQDTYELHMGGVILCHSPKGDVVLALLRAERFEPGYIRKALDPLYNIEEAAASADDRERARRERAAWDTSIRSKAIAEEEEARQRRFRTPISDAPADLDIDTLFSTL